MFVENRSFSYPCIRYMKNESLRNKYICNMHMYRYVIISSRLIANWIGENSLIIEFILGKGRKELTLRACGVAAIWGGDTKCGFLSFFIMTLEVLLRWKFSLLWDILKLCANSSVLYFSDRRVVCYISVHHEPLEVWCCIKLEAEWRGWRKCKASVDCIVRVLQWGYHPGVCSWPLDKTEQSPKLTRVQEWFEA